MVASSNTVYVPRNVKQSTAGETDRNIKSYKNVLENELFTRDNKNKLKHDNKMLCSKGVHFVRWSLTPLTITKDAYRKEEYSGNTVDLFLEGCFVRISVGTPAIFNEVFHNVPWTLQANTVIVLQLGHDRFLLNPLKFIIHQSSYHPPLFNRNTDSGTITHKRIWHKTNVNSGFCSYEPSSVLCKPNFIVKCMETLSL
jgi:hypothetical protein